MEEASFIIEGIIDNSIQLKWAIRKNTNEKFVLHNLLPKNSQQNKKEIKLLNQLKHKNIINLIKQQQQQQQATTTTTNVTIPKNSYFTPLMNFGDVENLFRNFYKNGLPEREILYLLKNLTQALIYLHEKNIIHRGICSRNILINSIGDVKLTGFKNAIEISKCNRWIGVENRVHEFGDHLRENFVWLAPEIFKQDLFGYGIESDIYSIGITIIEMGNGFAPFEEMEPLQILFAKLRGSTPFLLDSSTKEGCDESPENMELFNRTAFTNSLHKLIENCLSYTENDRPTAEKLLSDSILENIPSKNNFNGLFLKAEALKLVKI